jgi:plastocyanin
VAVATVVWVRRAAAAAVLAAACLLLIGPAVFAATAQVTMQDFSFTPPSTTVNVGDKVTWCNHGTVNHTATADGGDFDTLDVTPTNCVTVDFGSPGTFTYYCKHHIDQGMTGTIIVQGTSSSTVATTTTTSPPTNTTSAPGATTSTTRRATTTTRRATTATTRKSSPTSSMVESTTTSTEASTTTSSTEPQTSTTFGTFTLREPSSGNDTATVVVLVITALVGVGGGGYLFYRFRMLR